MIIQQLRLHNFGVYGGEQVFSLAPTPCNGFTRPVILVSGRNGSGKTTLMEAIRLCLHGSLALGTRVSRKTYEDHLSKRIHIPLGSAVRPSAAGIGLRLEYVSGGFKRTYHIQREWCLVAGNLRESVQILEDDEELEGLRTRKEKDTFLRELILPGVADLFFFDAEKLHTLAERDTRNGLLADTVKALLGLNLVDQLQDDLDVHLVHQKSEGSDTLNEQLDQAIQEFEPLREQRLDLLEKQRANANEIGALRRAIAVQEQKIASQGNWFATRLSELKLTRERLQTQIETERRLAQDLAGGLLPFAVTPELCLAVADRLEVEEDYEKKTAAQDALATQLELLSAKFESPAFWRDMDLKVNEKDRERLLSRIVAALTDGSSADTVAESDVILRLSQEDRRTLLRWIHRSTTEVPELFRHHVSRVDTLEEQLTQVEREMQLVPADETLKPLVQTLHQQSRALSTLQQKDGNLAEQLDGLAYELEQKQHERASLRDQIVEQAQHDQRIQLAHRSQLALMDYSRRLSREKVALLEERLIVRFNDLCRKGDLLSRASIDPKTFKISLYRQEQSMEFNQLSAGERQILALAIMWALREVSGLPMPIIIDTPFGRLDSVHRQNVIQKFLPRVSHQVILLSTDTDDYVLEGLAPIISRSYHLEWVSTDGRTFLSETTPACAPVMEKAGAE